MTDTFSSSTPSPGGQPPHSGSLPPRGQPADDVTGALAELERKLHELERELTSIGRRRVQPEAGVVETSGTAETPSVAQPPPTRGRLVDEQAEVERSPMPPPAPPPGRASAPGPAPSSASAPGSGPAPEPLPEHEAVEWATPAERATPVGEGLLRVGPMSSAGKSAPGAAGESVPSSDARLASLAELRRFRDRIERLASELTADYDAMLGRAMSGLSGRGGSEPTAAARADAAAPAAARGPEEMIYEGRVELGVGPFYDIGSLSVFEQSLAALPSVSSVAVRRFEASHAVVDLRLARPVALVSELRRALASEFSVRQVAEGRMLMTFDEA